MHQTHDSGSGHDIRSLIQLPIECHYFGIMNTIVTTVQSDLGDVVLTVTNCSTGSVWYDSFDSALEPQTILPISGAHGGADLPGNRGALRRAEAPESAGVYDRLHLP